jgi:hypothetical protein
MNTLPEDLLEYLFSYFKLAESRAMVMVSKSVWPFISSWSGWRPLRFPRLKYLRIVLTTWWVFDLRSLPLDRLYIGGVAFLAPTCLTKLISHNKCGNIDELINIKHAKCYSSCVQLTISRNSRFVINPLISDKITELVLSGKVVFIDEVDLPELTEVYIHKLYKGESLGNVIISENIITYY